MRIKTRWVLESCMDTKSMWRDKQIVINIFLLLVSFFCLTEAPSYSARIKDIANIKGVRENVLLGYGIVVGLKGTGDSPNELTERSLSRLFTKLGLDAQNPSSIKSKNAAAVIVTAKLPAFARAGN